MRNLTETEMSTINGGELHWIALVSRSCWNCYFNIIAGGFQLYTLITSFGGKAAGKAALKATFKNWLKDNWVGALLEVGTVDQIMDSCGACIDDFCGE